jgi:2-oxoglutarate ferredoxin oxidoreductase subunit alpha
MDEALASLDAEGLHVDALRVRAFPFHDEVVDFVKHHELVFVVEQNRDAQLRTLLVAEAGLPPERLVSVLHYDGTPITARFIHGAIAGKVTTAKVTPLKKTAAADKSAAAD